MKRFKPEDFIGSTFDTPKGGVLTVVGILPKEKGKDRKYDVVCSLCSEDKELFPETFKSDKYNLNRGRIPCECTTGGVCWTEAQNKVRVLRRCEEEGYEFLGWVGEYKSSTTKLNLYNKSTGGSWSSTILAGFIRGTGDPLANKKGVVRCTTPSDEERVLAFRRQGYSPKDQFQKNTVKKDGQGYFTYWDFICHKCSYDEYVEAGVCDGIFTTLRSCLHKGAKPCRCAKGYTWTEEQRIYQLSNLCKEEGLVFLGFKNGTYKDSHTKMRWRCSDGHLCEDSTVDSFLRGCRCKWCFHKESSFNGYYPERAEEKDYLYLMDFKIPIKVGRSFDVEVRRGSLKTSSGLAEKPEVLELYTATHQVVYDTEQAIHAELRERGFQFECDWTNECFTKDCWYILQEILEDYVSSGVLQRVNQAL